MLICLDTTLFFATNLKKDSKINFLYIRFNYIIKNRGIEFFNFKIVWTRNLKER